jgi:hypothetical protein
MTAVLVDSNVILDIFSLDKAWFAWSDASVERAMETGRLVVNPVIYAEISIKFSRLEALEAALPRDVWDREPIPFDAAFLAGKAYIEYKRRGGSARSPLPDFLIGAHAAVAGYTLLTRDASCYRTYFPRLALIAPD